MVQNKFYSKESTDITKYDTPKMFFKGKILSKDKFKVLGLIQKSVKKAN